MALGGNALIRARERGTAAEQLANLREALPALAPLLGDERVAITHGNGPQVGNELLRHERAAEEAPPLPLWLAVAQTQAEIGALIQAELRALAERPVACLLTHVRVDERDEAFEHPTKPVGPFYSEERARELERERGWTIVQDSGRGYRRVVPSPGAREIVELGAIRTLVESRTVAVCCGGGGIPVVPRDGQLRGIDAVIDKDRTSALLARELDAERLIVLTDVPAVYLDFRTSSERELREATTAEAEDIAAELPPGSMRPKLEACAEYVRATGGVAIITSAGALEDALAGRGGTRISG